MMRAEQKLFGGKQEGFTLVELMVVVAVLSVLLSFALPMFQNYARRARVAEGLSMADGLKSQLLEAYASNGGWPTDNAAAGLASASDLKGRAVDSITIEAATTLTNSVGSIVVMFNNKVGGSGANKLVISAQYTGGSGYVGVMQWDCSSDAGTNIPQIYLPPECRK